MVVMTGKWRGKCRRCGGALLPGTQIDWRRGEGAQHLTPEECLAATLGPPPVLALRGPQEERPEDRERATQLLLSHPRKVAKTMPKIPHEYTLRRLWLNERDFIWTVEYIRRVAYQERFLGRTWIYFDAGEHQYWDCGGAVADVGLINRAVRRPASARSKVASGS